MSLPDFERTSKGIVAGEIIATLSPPRPGLFISLTDTNYPDLFSSPLIFMPLAEFISPEIFFLTPFSFLSFFSSVYKQLLYLFAV